MKPWKPVIEGHVEKWAARLGNLGWWPRHVFHFTDVTNAAKIIAGGRIYSRAECNRRGLMVNDNASAEVISNTPAAYFEFVRMYFRPRTPTQYRNEGHRPTNQRWHKSHCGVPVIFCFNAIDVLSLDETAFSNGNMAAPGVEYGADRELFERIPFDKVFHNGAFSQDERASIVFHRHAEILVPDSLPLEPSLQFIACRSAAERQTLLHLLPPKLRDEWAPRIRIGEKDLFFRWWTFVEEVVAVGSDIVFKFNPDTQTPGPFSVRFTYQEEGSLIEDEWAGEVKALRTPRRMPLENVSRGVATLYLDDALAFSDTIIFDDVPF